MGHEAPRSCSFWNIHTAGDHRRNRDRKTHLSMRTTNPRGHGNRCRCSAISPPRARRRPRTRAAPTPLALERLGTEPAPQPCRSHHSGRQRLPPPGAQFWAAPIHNCPNVLGRLWMGSTTVTRLPPHALVSQDEPLSVRGPAARPSVRDKPRMTRHSWRPSGNAPRTAAELALGSQEPGHIEMFAEYRPIIVGAECRHRRSYLP